MKRVPKLKLRPDPLRVQRLEQLLAIAKAYREHRRPLPGGLRREGALLADVWGKRDIPREFVEAKRLVAGGGEQTGRC